MSQIEDLQSRITRALDRIGQGIDGLNPGPAPEDYEALRGRAEAAEQELAQTREAFAAAREQAEADLDAAVAAVRVDAAAEMERALAEAQTMSDTDEGDTPEVTELKEALDEEQMANAQLQERLRVLKARMAEAEDATRSEAAGAASLAALDAELQKLRAANEELMAANAALREANAQGVGEPELINRGMEAELEALRAARSAEAAETGAVLDALTPLLAEAAEDGSQG
ncbi:colicin transporter [Antarctobacter heliothermus]|uniref:Colicin transporter n=1 Tax=Antarctobacter heliothermus TaxID=74033 RepID=A0A222E7P8_9RHOB|nr:hypothetical protein [Antarctobacter heliothermus]ASP22225.1 colicin transporter [Antarctobacter heliothermus]